MPNKYVEYLGKTVKQWRIVHILVCSVIVCASVASCIAFAVCDKKFKGKCLLFSEVVIQEVTIGAYRFVRNSTSTNSTRFSSRSSCKVCTFTSIISSAFGAVWLVLFFVCIVEKKGASVSEVSTTGHLKLVAPSAMFAFCAAATCTGTDIFMTIGFSQFCNSFKKTILQSCEKAEVVKWDNFTRVNGFYQVILQVLFSSWMMAISWWLQCFLCSIRVYTRSDFTVAKERATTQGTVAHDS